MPAQTYALKGKSRQELRITWENQWQNVTITCDDEPVGALPEGRKALQKGARFSLPDGSRLLLRLSGKDGLEQLVVKQDDKVLWPLPVPDINLSYKRAYLVLYVVGVLNAGLGLAQLLWQLDPLQFETMGIAGIGSIFSGLVLIGLGVLVQRQRSVPALYSGVTVYTLDGILGYYFVAQAGGNPGFIGYLARAMFLYYLIQGITAMKKLNRA
ncbi:MAG: hypothetical protein KC418_22585 [Anaerolineales bacterium]|nr:hypothetical protein [Anaerolineales bacterium]MCB8953572.1 hypothetical protein [Ardenticatenales bacterium]